MRERRYNNETLLTNLDLRNTHTVKFRYRQKTDFTDFHYLFTSMSVVYDHWMTFSNLIVSGNV